MLRYTMLAIRRLQSAPPSTYQMNRSFSIIGLSTPIIRPMSIITPSNNDTNSDIPKLLDFKRHTHYKGGKYVVIGEGIHTETEEDLVFYYSADDLKPYARPKDMFNSDVEWNNKIVKRFTPE